MTLNDAQRKQVEENIGLVGKVIKDKVHGVNGLGIYTYDDLFQIGCIGPVSYTHLTLPTT